MTVTQTTRRGETFYLLQGLTKSGKPKYDVSKKPAANTVEQIPEGFGFYEHPADGIVHFPIAVTAIMSGIFGMPVDPRFSIPSITGGIIDSEVLRMLRTSPVLRFTISEGSETLVCGLENVLQGRG